MNNNDIVTVYDLNRVIKKNNDKLKEQGLGIKISEEEENAIEKREDGSIFVKNVLSELEEKSIIDKIPKYGHFTLSKDANVDIGDIVPFDVVENANGISIDNGIVTLTKGIYNVQVNFSDGANNGDGYYSFVNTDTDEKIGSGMWEVSSNRATTMNSGNSLVILVKVDDTMKIALKRILSIQNVAKTVFKVYSNLVITEIPTQRTVDPLQYSTKKTSQDILFETDEPILSGSFTLLKDYTEYDELYFEFCITSKKEYSTSSVKVDFLKQTNVNKHVLLPGFSNRYINIYMNDNDVVIVDSSSNGIVRVIGIKSNNPVICNYTNNMAVLDNTVLWSGKNILNASSKDNPYSITLSDDYDNYQFLEFEFQMYENKNYLYFKTISTDDILNNHIMFTFFQYSNAGGTIDTLYESSKNIKIGIGNWNKLINYPALIKITGYKGMASFDDSKYDDEIAEGIKEIWAKRKEES